MYVDLDIVGCGCNHWLYMEEPERFNALIRSFACGEM